MNAVVRASAMSRPMRSERCDWTPMAPIMRRALDIHPIKSALDAPIDDEG
jgi:hypothetical protein